MKDTDTGGLFSVPFGYPRYGPDETPGASIGSAVSQKTFEPANRPPNNSVMSRALSRNKRFGGIVMVSNSNRLRGRRGDDSAFPTNPCPRS
jgi:hypothetical protein